MVKYADEALDAVFAALADRTRRHVLESLAGGDRAVSELAAQHDMSLPGFMKHLRVLEEARLIERNKEGRVVSCELSAAPMKEAAAWIARYEKFWTEKLDALGRYLYQQEELQRWNPPQSAKRGKGLRLRLRASTPSRRKKSGRHGRTRKR